MITIFVMIVWYLDTNLREVMGKSGWAFPLILDTCMIIGLIEIMRPSCASIGGVLSGCA
jgi:hypothetical protein